MSNGTKPNVIWFKTFERSTWHIQRKSQELSRCGQIAVRSEYPFRFGGWPSPCCNNCVKTLDPSEMRD